MSSVAAAHTPSFLMRLVRRLRRGARVRPPGDDRDGDRPRYRRHHSDRLQHEQCRTSYLAGDNQNAYALGEAGLNSAMAVLAGPSSNALDPDTLPKCTSNETKYTDPNAQRTDQSTWRHDSYEGGTPAGAGRSPGRTPSGT